MPLNATTQPLRMNLKTIYKSSFWTLISSLSNSDILDDIMIYNYLTIKLILLFKAKFEKLCFMNYIFWAYPNSLCKNQCKPVLETAAPVVTYVLSLWFPIYTDFFDKVIHFTVKGM